MLKKLLVLFCLFSLSCCASSKKFVKEPDNSINTLMVGFCMYVNHAIDRKHFELFGTNASFIEITFTHLDSGKKIRLFTSGREGSYYITNMEPGAYMLTQLALNRGRIKTSLKYYKYFRIDEGKVNNMGRILWGDMRNINYDYETVRNWFMEKYPESLWINHEWKNVSFNDK